MSGLSQTCPTPISEMPTLLSEDMIDIINLDDFDKLERPNLSGEIDRTKRTENNASTCSSNLLYCVRWAPPIVHCFDFFRKYREAIHQPLGGNRKSSYHYPHVTIQTTMSVGPTNSRSCLPQRITLSNFKLGSPITSYGCIHRYWNSERKEAEYLIIRRTYSLSYADLIRGNYQESYLFFMIQYLTLVERTQLISQSFDFLWQDFHNRPAEGESYEYGLKIFSRIQPILPQLFRDFPSRDPYGKYLWLFPKGKPDYHTEKKDEISRLVSESPVQAALREYHEETNGCTLSIDNLVMSHPIIERHLGSNCKNYQTNYFVFQTAIRTEVQQFVRNFTNTPSNASNSIDKPGYEDIEMIKWIPYSEIDKYLCTARCHLLQYIEKHLVSNPKPTTINYCWEKPAKAHELVFG